jgi:GNAT superfamily N-acetyltransferase
MSDLHTALVPMPAPEGFAGMTFPVYRHLLALAAGESAPRHPEQNDKRPVAPLAIAAWLDGVAVGLLLAETPLEAPGDAVPPPALLSIFVQAAARRQGVAGALLLRLEEELAQRQFQRVELVYTTGKPGSAAVERLLASAGWSTPTTRTVLVHLVPGEMAASELFEEQRLASLDPGFEIFAWADLPAAEREALRLSDERQRWVTPGLAAWKFDHEPFDQAASVGARYRGEVVGWVIAQPISPTAVRYLCSFMRKDLSRRGRILPLYRASLARAAAAGRDLATFVTPVIYPSMIRFIHRWMAPHASLVAETRGSARELAQPSPGIAAAVSAESALTP